VDTNTILRKTDEVDVRRGEKSLNPKLGSFGDGGRKRGRFLGERRTIHIVLIFGASQGIKVGVGGRHSKSDIAKRCE